MGKIHFNDALLVDTGTIHTSSINHTVRIEKGLSISQCAILDFIYKSGTQELRKIGNHMNISHSSVSSNIKKLARKGYLEIKKYPDDEVLKMLGYHKSDFLCTCCDSNKNLQQHHYPVRRKDGGKDTITLCQDCHALFHRMADFGVISVTQKTKDLISDDFEGVTEYMKTQYDHMFE